MRPSSPYLSVKPCNLATLMKKGVRLNFHYERLDLMAIDYSALDRDALIDLVKKLDTTKKYGLVWEADRTREIFENDLHPSIPFLT